jgi:peptidoglycan/xylan/chitin deacetylase (PgdA/CDA1 family)
VTAIVAGVAVIAAVGTYGVKLHADRPQPISVRVAIDGQSIRYQLQEGDDVADALAVSGATSHDGKLFSAKTHRVLEPTLHPATVMIGGRAVAGSTRLTAGDELSVTDGKDEVEPTKQIDEAIPPPPMELVLTHVTERGVPGILRKVVGVRSGEVVSDSVVRAPTAPKRTTQKVVALTFDDGPLAAWTPVILKILADKGVKATFCEIGNQVRTGASLSRAVLAGGHQLCNHTVDHDERLNKATQAHIDDEIGGGAKMQIDAGFGAPAYYRPPGGTLSDAIKATARANNEQTLYWKVDTNDWRKTATLASVMAAVTSEADPGAIILMHDGGGNRSLTATALPMIIDLLRVQGYSFAFPVIDAPSAPSPVAVSPVSAPAP